VGAEGLHGVGGRYRARCRAELPPRVPPKSIAPAPASALRAQLGEGEKRAGLRPSSPMARRRPSARRSALTPEPLEALREAGYRSAVLRHQCIARWEASRAAAAGITCGGGGGATRSRSMVMVASLSATRYGCQSAAPGFPVAQIRRYSSLAPLRAFQASAGMVNSRSLPRLVRWTSVQLA
jgi:hypothetical protein